MLYPLLFIPIYKDYVWGGSRILEAFHRDGPSGKVAESWELSDRLDGMSAIENGPLKGKTLAEIFKDHKDELMGKEAHLDRFPLLIKLIDAEENLSVQVHPSVGKEAKTEAWFILGSEEESVVYAGFNKNYPKEEILKNLPSKDILSLMRTLPIHKDDTISIPGGRLHAIGAGCLLLEVQQNSNTTYRVYDWERGRPLHLEEAKKVLLYEDSTDPRIPEEVIENNHSYTRVKLIATPYFTVERWDIKTNIGWPKLENQWEVLFCSDGENSLVPIGRSCLVPAKCPPITVETDGTILFRIFS